MKRWNGWGDEATTYPLPDSAARYLADLVGEGAASGRCLAWNKPSGLFPLPASPPTHSISTDPEERLRHARGQSLPDWIALRSGQIGAFPDGVAYPASERGSAQPCWNMPGRPA